VVSALLLAACGGQQGAGAQGSGGDASSTSRASSAQASSSVAVAVSSGSGAGGAMAAPCKPAVPKDSFWAQQAQPWDNPTPVKMCAYYGDVVLVVDTAEL
jgi:hypothetical protein